MSEVIQALSWMMSLMDTPRLDTSLHSSVMPPGLSLTVTENLSRRPSTARPRSRQRPKIVVSMFPPQRGITTLEIFGFGFFGVLWHGARNTPFALELVQVSGENCGQACSSCSLHHALFQLDEPQNRDGNPLLFYNHLKITII
jgi:hypothetical protein